MDDVAAVVKGFYLIEDEEEVPGRAPSSTESLLSDYSGTTVGEDAEEGYCHKITREHIAVWGSHDVEDLNGHSTLTRNFSSSFKQLSEVPGPLTSPCDGESRESLPQHTSTNNFLQTNQEREHQYFNLSTSVHDEDEPDCVHPESEQRSVRDGLKRSISSAILENIIDDFTPEKGDQKILRAIGRTAIVNAAVLLTPSLGGNSGIVGYVTGGAITFKRLFEGLVAKDKKEVVKSLAVYGCATSASIFGQALTRAFMIGIVRASLPLAGAVTFCVGCMSGISAGSLSEWAVDKCMDGEVYTDIIRNTSTGEHDDNTCWYCEYGSDEDAVPLTNQIGHGYI